MSYYLLYIPGLGDHRVSGQKKALAIWRWWGAEAELLQMNWADKEPWEPKFDRLLARIDNLSAQGKRVALVGASAGAAAVINAYAARRDQIAGCWLIAGKVNRPDFIGQHIRLENPAFVTAASECQTALKSLDASYRTHILCRYGAVDAVVSKTDSYISGAHNRQVPTIGHVFTIATQLLFGVRSFIKFLNRS